MFINNGRSTAAAPRLEGGSTIAVASGHGARFVHPTLGAPTSGDPLRIQTGPPGSTLAVGFFKCIGVAGDTLIVQVEDGHDDAAVGIGDEVVAGWTAESIAEIGAGTPIPDLSLTDGSTITVDWAAAPIQRVRIAGDRTVAFTNVARGLTVRLYVKQDDTGHRVPTWPGGLLWMTPGGVPHVPAGEPGSTSTYTFERTAAGTYAYFSGDDVTDLTGPPGFNTVAGLIVEGTGVAFAGDGTLESPLVINVVGGDGGGQGPKGDDGEPGPKGDDGEPGPNTVAGLIEAGANVTLDGSGTPEDPYVINAAGGGGLIMVNGLVKGDGAGNLTAAEAGTDYLDPDALDDYALTADLASYVTTAALATALGDYVTSASLGTTLGGYVTSSALTTALGSYATTSALGAKADASALAALTTTVGSKADASALTALATLVAAKADSSAVTTLTATVAGKADASALAAKQDALVDNSVALARLANAAGASVLGASAAGARSDLALGSLLTIASSTLRVRRERTYGWGLPSASAGASGDADRPVYAPFACEVASIRMWAIANPTGTATGDVKAGGTGLAVTDPSLGAGVVGPVSASGGWTSSSITAGTALLASFSSVPSDSRGLTIEITIREVI